MVGEAVAIRRDEEELIRQRRDVRVRAVMNVRMNLLTSREFENEKELLESRASSFNTYYRWLTQQQPMAGGKEKDDTGTRLVHLMFDLQGRMNRVLQILERQAQGAPSFIPARTVDVSAGGIQLCTEHRLKVGDRVKLVLDIPLAHGIEIPALGDVRSVVPLAAEQPPMTAAGVRFAFIIEEDRDLLVRYVFQRQRDALRRRRMGEEE